jgi:uncharacterized protein YjiS (DUF1127 family)
MQASSVVYQRGMRRYAGRALIGILIATAVAGWRALSRVVAAIARMRRRKRLHRELHYLSDHVLRDIGLDRRQIDRLLY